MKLGEGGEAFFVFETKDDVPESLQTSPLVSPTGSPKPQAGEPSSLQEPEFLDLDKSSTSLGKIDSKRALGMPPHLSGSMRASTDIGKFVHGMHDFLIFWLTISRPGYASVSITRRRCFG